MKIAAAFMFIVVALLGMIVALGYVDGQFGDGPGSTDQATGIEKAYLEFVVARLETTGTNVGNLGYLITNAEFDDDEWQTSVYLTMNQIQAALANVKPLDAPPRLTDFHEASVQALSHSATFAELIEARVDTESAEVSDVAVDELVAAANAFATADDLLQEFLDEHPLPEELELEEMEPALEE
ncbi:MAG: hypothetical protein ACOC9B_07585 [Chloroflexota bacterium]